MLDLLGINEHWRTSIVGWLILVEALATLGLSMFGSGELSMGEAWPKLVQALAGVGFIKTADAPAKS